MPSINVVAKIAEALEVSIDYLIGKTKLQIDMALRDFKAKRAYINVK